MPYASNADLPPTLQRRLPEYAQSIFRAAFNHAWQAHRDEAAREEIAHRIAWAAVKRQYVRSGEMWVAKI